MADTAPLLHCLPPLPVLKKGVTDEGLRALASAGCGRKMTSRCFSSEGAFVWMEVFPPLRVMMIASLFLCPLATRIDLGGGVADSGLRALAAARGGQHLRWLLLEGEFLFPSVSFFVL